MAREVQLEFSSQDVIGVGGVRGVVVVLTASHRDVRQAALTNLRRSIIGNDGPIFMVDLY
jgi:hypothetical protein